MLISLEQIKFSVQFFQCRLIGDACFRNNDAKTFNFLRMATRQ